MQKNRQKSNWLIDAALFAGFILAFFLDLTGVIWHQWLGVAVGAFALYHLVTHWDWVKAVTRRFLGRTSTRSRLYYGVDAGLMAGFLAILATGLVISTWANLALDDYPAWKNVHVAASVATLALIVIKIAVHWRWIVDVARRSIFKPASQAGAVRTAAASSPTGRREFLKLMGLVNLAAAVAACRVLEDAQETNQSVATASPGATATPAQTESGVMAQDATQPATETSLIEQDQGELARIDQPEAAPAAQASFTPVPEPSPAVVAQESPTPAATATVPSTAVPTPTTAAASNQCVVRCNRGCSYPGRCRRYVDANDNNRCDLGECL